MSLLIGSSLALLLASADIPPATVQAIGAKYQGPVAKAFEAHCADCHGKLPATLAEPARTTAGNKAKKAHKKLDMDNGFPFASKWDLPKLMAEIRKSVGDGDMPPAKYQKQKGAALSDADRQAIVKWAKESEALLGGQP